MSSSYLLDEDPGVDDILSEFDLLRGVQEGADNSTVLSAGHKPDHDKSLRSSQTINNAPAEFGFVDFPSAARFVLVNAPSLIPRPTLRKFQTHERGHVSTNVSELRSLVLAATDSIDKPFLKKKMAVTASFAGARSRKRNPGSKKEHLVFTVAEDPVGCQAQFPKSLEVTETRGAPPQITRSTTLLGQLSEKTLNKLHAFTFIPLLDCATPPTKTAGNRTGHNAVFSENLGYLRQPDIPSVDDEDSYDEFDLDENIFDNIYADDDVDYHTPDSTTLAADHLNIDPLRCDQRPPQATPLQVPPQPRLSPRNFKTPLKPINPPIVPISPFLRSSLPQLASSQSVLPSLMPHRRIPTLFRIAEVHRLLATLPPRAPPQRIELYAKVPFSCRNPNTKTQAFTFADIFFPHRPPYLCGTYTAWTAGELFDKDSAPFLDTKNGGKLCRAIVQVSKKSWNKNARPDGSSPLPMHGGSQGGGKEADALDVEVLNVWEATWDDVEYVKGLVGA